MDQKLSIMLDEMAHSMAKPSVKLNNLVEGEPADQKSKPRQPSRRKKLPEKEFRFRQSPLTELLEVPHFRTIHHIFLASLILMMLHGILIDVAETGTVDLGLERLLWALGEPGRTWTLIGSLHLSSICVLYPAFYYWAHSRQQASGSGGAAPHTILVDRLALLGVSVFMILFTAVPGFLLWQSPLPFGSGLVATMEQCRLLMKMYAFIRSNVPRALKFSTNGTSSSMGAISEENSKTLLISQPDAFDKGGSGKEGARLRQIARSKSIQAGHADSSANSGGSDTFKLALRRHESWLSTDNDSDSPCPCFTKYLYFLFAPTLIYRDEYPRTKKIRWNHVCWNFSQVLGCAFYANFLLGRSLSAQFGKFGLPGHEMSLMQLLQATFSLMLPATLTLMLIFFMVLHTWQNAFAEMLYFGDRQFYKDWWNCSNFAVYYKTWNVLVHDWLFNYILKDAAENGLGEKFKALPTVLVFVVSALFHEYILCVSFHFFFPVLFLLFGGFGFAFMFVGNRKRNSKVGNVLMWMGLMSGTGIIIAAYSMEHYARRNCPLVVNDNFFLPRTFACNAIKFS